MLVQALLRGLVIGRHDEQRAVHAQFRRLLRQANAGRRVVAARARDHLAASARRLLHQPKQAQFLVMRERGRLARRAAHHDAVRAIVQQMLDQPLPRRPHHAPLRVERRHHRRQHLPKHSPSAYNLILSKTIR